jgi:hypothetical protein
MLNFIRILVAVVILFFGPITYACGFPDPVPIPDGAMATEREMVAADLAIKQYISQMQAYVDCVELETQALRRSGMRGDMENAKVREEKAIRDKNRAASAIEDVAERFNNAVSDYKERNR